VILLVGPASAADLEYVTGRRFGKRPEGAAPGPAEAMARIDGPFPGKRTVVNIGVYNEGPLHQALKDCYSVPGARQEVSVGSFVADVQHPDDVIYEIQTGGFGALRRKLARLLTDHRVVLVHPIAGVRYLVKLSDDADGPISRRRSPKRGCIAQVVCELVSIPSLLDHPNFELEVVLTEEEELRRPAAGGGWRRKGWRVVQRRLTRVLETRRFTSSADLFGLLQEPLPETFTTAELATALAQPRWLAQKLAYCLREAGRVEVCGKRGNALEYRRANGPA
jgi:hypothetical protein